MRSFLGTHWKALVALILLIALAVVTMNTGSARPTLAARLRAHVDAIAGTDRPAAAGSAARHIAASLADDGYRVRRERWRSGEHTIEGSLSSLAPGQRAARVFVIGANGASGSGAAAVLELARLLGKLQPIPGTEVRFVFFLGQDVAAPPAPVPRADDGEVEDPPPRYPDTGNFIAFVGSPAESRRVQETLSAFRAASDFPSEGFATPAFVQGVTVSARACARCGGRALTISDSAFLGYPYYHTGADDEGLDYEAIARVVSGLARTIGVLAEGQRG